MDLPERQSVSRQEEEKKEISKNESLTSSKQPSAHEVSSRQLLLKEVRPSQRRQRENSQLILDEFLEPEDAKEPSSESYSRVVNEYMKEEEKKGEKSLPRSKAEVSSVSSIDLNDLSESFYNNRGKYLPLEQLRKKTKNRNAGQKVHEAKQVAEVESL